MCAVQTLILFENGCLAISGEETGPREVSVTTDGAFTVANSIF